MDQFFECFDGMRSCQSALGNSGMWKWTCSVFSAITAASSLASGSLHISNGMDIFTSLYFLKQIVIEGFATLEVLVRFMSHIFFGQSMPHGSYVTHFTRALWEFKKEKKSVLQLWLSWSPFLSPTTLSKTLHPQLH